MPESAAARGHQSTARAVRHHLAPVILCVLLALVLDTAVVLLTKAATPWRRAVR